nr:IPT/TIG domain-containing protein [uncultured Flavobacterium sp.]
MKNKISFAILLLLSIFINACSKTEDDITTLPNVTTNPDPVVVVQTPVVPAATFTSFSPKNAYLGDVVTIYGANLDKNLKLLSVDFGGVETEILGATSTSLTVAVPNDLNKETAKIRLRTAGVETPLESEEDFHLNAPIITSISHTKGFSGQKVIIKGKGFRDSRNIVQIAFNGVDIETPITDVGNSELRMDVPRRLDSGKYPITVTIAGMTATAPSLFEVVVPTISSITPTTGGRFTTITITGTNLKDIYGIETSYRSVFFTDAQTNVGGSSGTILSSEENKIEVKIPDNLKEGKTYKVQVIVVSGRAEAKETFIYTK